MNFLFVLVIRLTLQLKNKLQIFILFQSYADLKVNVSGSSSLETKNSYFVFWKHQGLHNNENNSKFILLRSAWTVWEEIILKENLSWNL